MNHTSFTELKKLVLGHFPSCPDSVIVSVEHLFRGQADRLDWTYCLEKPYGTNRIQIVSSDYGVSWAEFRPGSSTSFHHHCIRRELFLVAAGVLELTTEDSQTLVHTADSAASTPFVNHRLSNPRNDFLRIAEIFSPALVDDKVRVADFYHRKLGSVNHVD